MTKITSIHDNHWNGACWQLGDEWPFPPASRDEAIVEFAAAIRGGSYGDGEHASYGITIYYEGGTDEVITAAEALSATE